MIRLLAEYGYVAESEPVEHWTLLPKLYNKPSNEIKILFEIQVLCSLAALNPHAQIYERSIDSALGVFVPMLLPNPAHWKLVSEVSALLPQPQPDFIIYLDCDIDVAMDRIKKRGRGPETDISHEYMLDLHTSYESWLRSRSVPIYRIDVTKLEPCQVLAEVLAKLDGCQRLDKTAQN